MKKLFLAVLISLFAMTIGVAQEESTPEEQTVQISLPKYCCSESDALIERTLAYEKGVESFQLNPITKSVLVTFKTKKTNQMKIEKALAKSIDTIVFDSVSVSHDLCVLKSLQGA